MPRNVYKLRGERRSFIGLLSAFMVGDDGFSEVEDVIGLAGFGGGLRLSCCDMQVAATF